MAMKRRKNDGKNDEEEMMISWSDYKSCMTFTHCVGDLKINGLSLFSSFDFRMPHIIISSSICWHCAGD